MKHGDVDAADPSFVLEFQDRLREKLEKDAERDRQIAALRESVVRLAKVQRDIATALNAALMARRMESTGPEAGPFVEQEQRMLTLARNGEKLLREFNEAFDDAERRKRENERRLRVRLAEIRAAHGTAA
ncbi:MAG TPA: hypothetical protein VFT45_26740 [Longimicrobium sp.]|nr:hypothetical protein [Longimicrobium sp.]